MTDLRKAAEMALEALEAIRGEKDIESAHIIAKNARYSLREALAQPEPFKPDWVSYRQGVADGAAQHEQESPHSAKGSADSAETFGKPDIGLPDPCPQCRKGGVCRTPKCGRLQLPAEHPYRNQALAQPEDLTKMYDSQVESDAMRLYQAVDRLATQAGEDAKETIDWLCEHSGMFKLFEAYFSPKPLENPLENQSVASGSPIDSSTHSADSSTHMNHASMKHLLNLVKNGWIESAQELIEAALAQPEQEPKLSDAGVDTNIPLWGLEPKGKGMVTFHQHNPEHQPWCDYLNIMLTSMPPQRANCNCKTAQPEQEPVAWLVSDAQGRYATIRDPAPYGEEVYEPLYTAPPKPEQWTPVEIGVDVTPEGAHVVGMYVLMPEAVRHVFYSQFHPAFKREWVGLTDDEIKKIMQRWRGEFDIRDIERLLKEKNT